MTLRRLLPAFAAALALAFGRGSAGAQQVDVIRGRVVGPDSLPIENVNVTVTTISGGVNRTARTDRNGRYTVTFPGGDGDYFVTFAAIGFGARRFEVKRVADEDFLVADARLQRSANVLDKVTVTAPRDRVNRNDATPDIGGTERTVDANGNVARVMSVPRPNDAMSLIGGPNGTPGFDAQGRLVYRAPPAFRAAQAGTGDKGGFPMPEFPESTAVVRIDLATRQLDTVAFVRIPRSKMSISQDANGRMGITSIINPMPQADDWAVLSDGSVAVVRSSDYHIDWIRNDGTRSSSPKVPFPWRHLSDEDKAAYIDSTKAAMEKIREQANAQRAAGGAGPVVLPPPDAGGGGVDGVMTFSVRAKAEAIAGGRGDGPRPAAPGAAPANITVPPLQFVAPADLPDYAPPFAVGAARGDRDGNLWIRTSNVVAGGSVYDIIDAKGQLVDRVQLPAGRVIAGFGPGGLVYMGVRDGAGVRLEMARVQQRGIAP